MTNDGPRMTNNETSSPLDAFLPAVQTWFYETFGEPTPPQAMGWPAIQRGEHTLILSPTGSGKTLAAFLWGIDQLYRETLEQESQETGESREEGVRLLYVSPLKALNNDVERNLRAPLAGIRRVAEEQGSHLPRLSVLVRTGDTPQSVRRQMVKHPPHILITTPESLYLILTSPVAREMFRTVRTLIVDEIHTLVGNKRGVHLAVSLERVVELAGRPIQRIGLSATQRPLDEVARFLGGYESQVNAERGTPSGGLGDPVPRPVTIVDAGMVKPMDLKVITAVEDFSDLPGGSIWPAIIPQVMDLIEAHRTTLVFANSRRQAERAADRLNDLYLARQAGRAGGPEAMMEGGAVKGLGIQGTGAAGGPFRAHHGSVSREARLQLEQALKDGPAAGAGGHLVAGAGHRHRRRGPGRAAPVAQGGGPGPAAGGTLRPPGGPDQRGPLFPHPPRGPARDRRPSPGPCSRATWSRPTRLRTASMCWPNRSWPWSACRTGTCRPCWT